jgi:hypothetical protein
MHVSEWLAAGVAGVQLLVLSHGAPPRPSPLPPQARHIHAMSTSMGLLG